MEQVNFTGSMKNVPQAGREEYVMNFTHRMQNLITGMQWHAAFVLGILKPGKDKETWGYNSLQKPPFVPQLEPFKSGMADFAAGLRFKKHTNDHQLKMREEISKMDRSKEKWKIECYARSYTLEVGHCDLCATEKYLIVKNFRNRNLVNDRSEFISTYRHCRKFLLNRYGPKKSAS